MSEQEGASALDAVAAFIGRYVVFPSEHCITVVALWVAHTHAGGGFYVTPRLVLDSAEPGSGKTRVLELLKLLVHRPIMSINTTTAALYRRIAERKELGEQPPTVLLDETDAIFGPRSAPQHEDLRALLNSGYKKGATVDRCVGDGAKIEVVEFPVHAPVALAGLAGAMPATITSRSVTIHMRRRAPGEEVEPFRERHAERDAQSIREALAAWIGSVSQALAEAEPDMPKGVVDRPAEVWEALLAVADAAGGDWPKLAREACRYFVLDSSPTTLSLGVRLLSDLKGIFGEQDRMQTTEVLAQLTALEEAPWGDLYGKPLDARRLAKELNRYGVGPATFKTPGSDKAVKGYTTYATKDNVGLADAWRRYLPREPVSNGNDGNSGNSAGQSGYRSVPVTDGSVTGHDPKPVLSSEVTQVTAVTGNTGSCPECDQVPSAGAWAACAKCGARTHRYGPGNHGSRCAACRADTA